MSSLFIKGVLATALALGAINSFAQDAQIKVTCGDGTCACDSGGGSACCGQTSCTLSGFTCTCT
jgi:hypothetical protein